MIIIMLLNVQCTDIDECFEAAQNLTDICQDVENSQCINTIGSYNCSCVSGYQLIGAICQRKSVNNLTVLL